MYAILITGLNKRTTGSVLLFHRNASSLLRTNRHKLSFILTSIGPTILQVFLCDLETHTQKAKGSKEKGIAMYNNNNNNYNNNNDDDDSDNIAAQESSHLRRGTNNEGMEVSLCEEYYREQNDEEERAVVILLFAMGLVLGYDDLMKRIRGVGRIKILRKHKLKVAQKRYEILQREQQTPICVIPKPTAAWSVDQLKRWMHANPITGQNNIDFIRSTMESTDFGLNPPFEVVIPASLSSSNEQHTDANNDEPQEEEEEKRGEESDNTAQESFMAVVVLPSNEDDNGNETNRESHQGEEQDGDVNNDEPQEEEEEAKEEGASDKTAQEPLMDVAVLPSNQKVNGYETHRESHQGENAGSFRLPNTKTNP